MSAEDLLSLRAQSILTSSPPSPDLVTLTTLAVRLLGELDLVEDAKAPAVAHAVAVGVAMTMATAELAEVL